MVMSSSASLYVGPLERPKITASCQFTLFVDFKCLSLFSMKISVPDVSSLL
jgi:hypothetical protein